MVYELAFCHCYKRTLSLHTCYVLFVQLLTIEYIDFYLSEEFKKVISATEVYQQIPFNFDCSFVTRHFGKDKKKELSYAEFTQFLWVRRVPSLNKDVALFGKGWQA